MSVVIPIGIAMIAVFVAERSAGLAAFVAVLLRITILAGSVRVKLSTRGNQCKDTSGQESKSIYTRVCIAYG